MSKQSAPSQGQTSNIFINYRRDDTAGYAGRLFDRLSERFGDRVFMDVDYIDPGLDFVEVIEKAVGSCDVLIVMIGKQWLTITDKHGKRRLDNPDDFVRVEIEAALKRDIRVIPVLVDDAAMPHRADLPPTLLKLARRNAIELSDARWAYDVQRLMETLEEVLAGVEGREPGRQPEASRGQKARGASGMEAVAVKPQPRSSGALLKAIIGISAAVILLALGALLFIFLWKRDAPDGRQVAGINTSSDTGVANAPPASPNNADSRVTNNAKGSATNNANAKVTDSPSATTSAASEPYCVAYSPGALRIESKSDDIWSLIADTSYIIPRLDNKADAERALAVAKQHTARCFIGRGNRRPESRKYMMSYWTGGKVMAGTLTDEDCLGYDPQQLRIEDQGTDGWLLTDGRSRMLMLDNKADAEQALAVAKRFKEQCFIGRNNTRPGRKYYIVEYWK
jgi:hypothetical protein